MIFWPEAMGKTLNSETGNWGEEIAAQFLQAQKAFTIVHRNLRLGRSEVDILCMDDLTLVFVEVKVRKNSQFGHPESFVDAKKASHLHRAADLYLEQTGFAGFIRFDVVAITGSPKSFEILHLPDFF